MNRRGMLASCCAMAGVLALSAPGQDRSSLSGPLSSLQGISRGEALARVASALGLIPPEGGVLKCGLPVHAALRRRRAADPAGVDRAAAILFPRTPRQTSILRSGWRIHFDTTGIHEPALLDGTGARIPGSARAFAESVGTVLARVIAVEQGGLGYPAPLGDGSLGGGDEPDLYIEELGGTYGLTYPDVEGPAGATSTAFVTIDNDFAFVSPPANRGLPGMEVTVAHEFHHVIELSRYGYWPNDIYYYEMTCTWLEDVVYTDVNDYLNYLWWSNSQFSAPTVPFTSNEAICYSRGIWCHFLAKSFGANVIRRSWEEIGRQPPLQALDAALREAGSTFSLAFNDWTRWNYYTAWRADTVHGYPEGRSYPPMAQLSRQYVAPLLTLQGGLDPLAARYHEVVVPRSGGGADTLTVAAARIDIGSVAGGSESYTISLRSAKVDESFQETGTALFAAFSAPRLADWGIWYLSASGSVQPFGLAVLAEGTPFPNPFRPDGTSSLSIPIDAQGRLSGALQVFNTRMESVYQSGGLESSGGVRQVFSWNGRTPAGNLVPTGVYLYVLTLSDGRTMQGKFAVLRP